MGVFKKRKEKKKGKEPIPNSEKTAPISVLLLLKMKFKTVWLIYLLHHVPRPRRFLAFHHIDLQVEMH